MTELFTDSVYFFGTKAGITNSGSVPHGQLLCGRTVHISPGIAVALQCVYGPFFKHASLLRNAQPVNASSAIHGKIAAIHDTMHMVLPHDNWSYGALHYKQPNCFQCAIV